VIVLKLTDVISSVGSLRDNIYGDNAIAGWCSDLDQDVAINVLKKYKYFDVSRIKDQASYSLPAGLKFYDIETMYVDKKPIPKIDFMSLNKEGFYQDMEDETKFLIYPIPSYSDTSPGIRGVYIWRPAVYTPEYTGDLLIPDMFKRIYTEFCMAKLSQLDEDPVNYANYMRLYNNTWKEYAKWYNRTGPVRESRTSNVI
jgi:hypothetical protein